MCNGDEFGPWFDKLNEFERRETKRQVAFKDSKYPGLPDGSWSKKPSLKYPHILPEGSMDKVFYSGIAKDIYAYCTKADIAFHSELLNLRSSQACCFNIMFPLKQELNLAAKSLVVAFPQIKEATRIEFEYTGDDGATRWLGEPSGGKRGQNRTSIDVAIWWNDGAKNYLTLVEWKYTEKAFGTCGGSASDNNENKAFCSVKPSLSYITEYGRCYLETLGRHYWDHLKQAGIDLSPLVGVKGCPFRGPFYQLMRQHLLAAYLRITENVDEVYVCLAHFKGNTSLSRMPREYSHLGKDIIDAWNSLLTAVPTMQSFYVEELFKKVKEVANPNMNSYVSYIEQRYGL